jgi:hypothetical protein
LPTNEQVFARLSADRDRLVSVGESYLTAHGFHAPSPTPTRDPHGNIVHGSPGD